MKKQSTIIILAALILVILGGLVYWQYSKKPVVVNTNQNTNNNQNTNIDNTNTDDNEINTSDWVEYINNIYGYHLQIPPEYKNKSVYENTYIPLNSEMSALNLVNNDSSIKITTEDRSLFEEEGNLESILLQRADKYGYKIHKINNITFIENNSFPENGTTFSVAMEDKVLSITFTNVDQNIIDIITNTFKFTN